MQQETLVMDFFSIWEYLELPSKARYGKKGAYSPQQLAFSFSLPGRNKRLHHVCADSACREVLAALA